MKARGVSQGVKNNDEKITRDTLQQIMDKPLFSNVGKLESSLVIAVHSWREAFEECSRIEYKNLRLRASNQISLAMDELAKDVFNETWSLNVREIKEFLKQYIEHNLSILKLSAELSERFRGAVEWDLMGLGLEAEYSDYVKPGFFAGLSYWYDQGHFPCGWKGKYPKGKLMVY